MIARRLWAGLIDATPFAVALWLTLPLVAALALQGSESRLGVGLFDPTTGVDPVLTAHLVGERPLAVGAAVGASAWLTAEAIALVRRRRSIGAALAGLTLE